MSEFPRTVVGGISVSRLIIGTNWFLGYSHSTAAKSKFVTRNVTTRSKIAEIIAVINDPKTAKRPFNKKLSQVNYYWLDRAAKTCTLKGTLAVNPAAYTRLGIGDLNSDGCMDVLYTGGVFTRGEETKIFVLYGKVKNIPRTVRRISRWRG